MTQKILEAAAKACGFKKWRVLTSGLFQVSNNENWNEAFAKWTDWNPLTNSSDCAAMCAKLKIDTTWEDVSVFCSVPMFLNATWFEDHNNDREAAWRFAACKVAEAIGRAMK